MKAVFSPPPHIAKGDEAGVLEEYADALQVFAPQDLREGWKTTRDTHTRAFWPPVGMLVEACADARHRRHEAQPKREGLNGRDVNGQFQPWGGGCQCDACVYKIPRPGFYKAPKGEREAANALTRECEDWMWRKMYGPGTPPVADFTGEEIIITADRAKAVMEATRKKFNYGPQYAKYRPPRDGDERAPLSYVPTPPDVAAARERVLQARLQRDTPTDEADQ